MTSDIKDLVENEGGERTAEKLSTEDATNLECPRCNYDLGDLFMSKLSEVTGITIEKFQNGEAQKEISFKMKLAEVTLTKARAHVEQYH